MRASGEREAVDERTGGNKVVTRLSTWLWVAASFWRLCAVTHTHLLIYRFTTNVYSLTVGYTGRTTAEKKGEREPCLERRKDPASSSSYSSSSSDERPLQFIRSIGFLFSILFSFEGGINRLNTVSLLLLWCRVTTLAALMKPIIRFIISVSSQAVRLGGQNHRLLSYAFTQLRLRQLRGLNNEECWTFKSESNLFRLSSYQRISSTRGSNNILKHFVAHF